MAGKGARSKTGTRSANDKETQPGPSKHDEAEEEDKISALTKLINIRFDEICSVLAPLQATTERHGSRLNEVETALQHNDDRTTALEAVCESLKVQNSELQTQNSELKKYNKLLTAKMDDLDSRSRRQNLRVMGIPEGAEGDQAATFMTAFFANTLGMEIPAEPEILDQAHRLASRQNAPPGAPPRPMMVRVHRSKVKQQILQLAREKGPLTFRGKPVHIFPDYTAEVAKQRAAFHDIKQKLRAANIRYGLLYPARLQVSFNNERSIFATADDVTKFYEDRIAPTLQPGPAEGATGGAVQP